MTKVHWTGHETVITMFRKELYRQAVKNNKLDVINFLEDNKNVFVLNFPFQ